MSRRGNWVCVRCNKPAAPRHLAAKTKAKTPQKDKKDKKDKKEKKERKPVKQEEADQDSYTYKTDTGEEDPAPSARPVPDHSCGSAKEGDQPAARDDDEDIRPNPTAAPSTRPAPGSRARERTKPL